ncbi:PLASMODESMATA CALLOSE-BINDING PROTEIN 2 [Zea mays]|uniref:PLASMODESMATA CALLOSE-BINDING PROTEIN 2 n=1 Tax=Zea mays TaxID=4577 RepID=A0A1D6FT96_MAIZE|nr:PLASMODESMATA CALLOSE-BINDING PROTEIN 2 [Zea mays]
MAAPLFLLLLLLAMFTGSDAAFCVCKTGVPDQAMQAAIDYACAKGADCASASKGAPCYGNGNKVAVCSYICNSYYQSRSATGATCDFNGVATLTGTDPSSGTCKFASGPSAGTGGGMGAGTGAGTGVGTGAGTGMGTGTGTSTGTGAGAGVATPGSALSPPFGGTGAYGPSGAGSTDYNDAVAPRAAGLHVVAALALAVAVAAPLHR